MIPSPRKKINELLAKQILQHYSSKYENIQCFDKPDLIDKTLSLGIEVTSDLPEKEWKRLVCQGHDDTSCKLAFTEAKIVTNSTINTKKVIYDKLHKAYYMLAQLELFIFISDIQFVDEFISDLIEYWLVNQENSATKFERLFFYPNAAEMLFVCESKTKKCIRIKFPDNFSR
jgi:hypothetical protein